jgi:hypothetical protein
VNLKYRTYLQYNSRGSNVSLAPKSGTDVQNFIFNVTAPTTIQSIQDTGSFAMLQLEDINTFIYTQTTSSKFTFNETN